MLTNEPLMEISVMKWASFISGWKKRIILVERETIQIIKSKTDLKRKNNIKSISILNSKVIDENKKRQFIIEFEKKKLNFKADMEEDKYKFIEKINELKNGLVGQTKQNLPSPSSSTINNNNDSISDIIEISKSQIQKLLVDIENMNKNILQLKAMEKNFKKNASKFKDIIESLLISGADIQKTLQLCIFEENNKKLNNAVIEANTPKKEEEKKEEPKKEEQKQIENDNNFIHNALVTSDNKPNLLLKKETPLYDEDSIIDPNEDSSDEDVPSVDDIKSISQIISDSHKSLSKFERGLSSQITDFYDPRYQIPSKQVIPVELKYSDTFVKDMVKSLTSKKSSFPITYNEPISMLQKQCEKFFYCDLLNKASADDVPSEMKIVYIIGFIAGELSQNINRFLKPFNPILGETFEFFDNERKFRFFSEQVSHNPPISAFLCESSDFVYFGDTRFKSSFKFLKGAMELSFTNKTHILFKKSNKKYVFNKPNCYLNGVMKGTPRYDCEGQMTIVDVDDKTIKAELNFHEDKGKKDIPLIEGDVYKGNDIIYKIKGSWKDTVYYSTDGGNEWKEIWSVYKEEFLNNSIDHYVLPEYALGLNYYGEELKFLPVCDSRKRPDQREYENGNVEKALEIKNEIEEKQRERHKKFDEDKIIYEPIYFKNIFDNTSEDFVYVYKGDYFEERKTGTYPRVVDIFDITKK